MFIKNSVSGYAPDNINYCPECGCEEFPHSWSASTGAMSCHECGLQVYLVEGDDSHRGEETEE